MAKATAVPGTRSGVFAWEGLRPIRRPVQMCAEPRTAWDKSALLDGHQRLGAITMPLVGADGVRTPCPIGMRDTRTDGAARAVAGERGATGAGSVGLWALQAGETCGRQRFAGARIPTPQHAFDRPRRGATALPLCPQRGAWRRSKPRSGGRKYAPWALRRNTVRAGLAAGVSCLWDIPVCRPARGGTSPYRNCRWSMPSASNLR